MAAAFPTEWMKGRRSACSLGLKAARFTGMGSPRAAQLAAVIEAKRFDSGSLNLQLSLRRLTLYDGDLTQSLYEFDIPAASTRPMPEIVSKLLSPPPGVMPMKLPVLDGDLVLGADAVTDQFLTLVAMEPLGKLLKDGSEASRDDRFEMALVRDFLSPEAQRQLLKSAELDWRRRVHARSIPAEF